MRFLKAIGVMAGLAVVLALDNSGLGGMADKPFSNSLGMQFVLVAGLPGVLFSKWETRNKDYEAFVKATGHRSPECAYRIAEWNTWQGQKPPGGYGDHPVVGVRWQDAKDFCIWLTNQDRAARLIGGNEYYRLPTDHEWSLAVGLKGENPNEPLKEKDAKIKGIYPWGIEWPPPKGAGNYPPNLGVDDDEYTSPAGKYGEQANGLCDMGGNVFEWCEDKYDPSDSSENAFRVLRGGSWLSIYKMLLLSSFRYRVFSDVRFADIGFRCVLAAVE